MQRPQQTHAVQLNLTTKLYSRLTDTQLRSYRAHKLDKAHIQKYHLVWSTMTDLLTSFIYDFRWPHFFSSWAAWESHIWIPSHWLDFGLAVMSQSQWGSYIQSRNKQTNKAKNNVLVFFLLWHLQWSPWDLLTQQPLTFGLWAALLQTFSYVWCRLKLSYRLLNNFVDLTIKMLHLDLSKKSTPSQLLEDPFITINDLADGYPNTF